MTRTESPDITEKEVIDFLSNYEIEGLGFSALNINTVIHLLSETDRFVHVGFAACSANEWSLTRFLLISEDLTQLGMMYLSNSIMVTLLP